MTTAPESFFKAYLATALWSSTDDDGEPLDARFYSSDIDTDTLEKMRKDCSAFYATNHDDLNCDDVTYGPDFDQDGRAGQAMTFG